jgi:tRNA-Thr(GGU) m(6)t(6)A37 methyltransferase TsaA
MVEKKIKIENIAYRPIGIIHTPFKRKKDTPIQGCYSKSYGEVEVFPEYSDGLRELEGFSHIFLIYHFHLAEGCFLFQKPFLDKNKKGIFAIRHYNRPNNIGISLVRLFKIDKNILQICNVDILDNTPLLDIKPYVKDFDVIENATEGWYAKASNKSKYKKNY